MLHVDTVLLHKMVLSSEGEALIGVVFMPIRMFVPPKTHSDMGRKALTCLAFQLQGFNVAAAIGFVLVIRKPAAICHPYAVMALIEVQHRTRASCLPHANSSTHEVVSPTV